MKRFKWSVGLLLLVVGFLVLGGSGCTSSPDSRTSSYEKDKAGKKTSRAPYRREGSGY